MVYDRTKPFNDLPLLPPKGITDDVDILKKLVTSSRALAGANSNVQRLPNPYMLINTISLQEAKASSAIENIFTTEDELYKAVSDTVKEEHANPATKEVLRYREALWEGYRRTQEKRTIDLESIIAIFRQIKNTSSGLRPPHSLTVIQRGQSEFRSGEVIYTPPRGQGIIERLLDNLLVYLNDDAQFDTDPLLKMCIAHYQFEAIHPFPDGNGRTGRIINLLYLANKGLLDQPVLYLSKYIITHKDDYYYNLGVVSQRGNWKPWVLYMLDAVEKTSILTNQLISSILNQMESTLEYARSRIKWYNKEVNELLFSQPYIKQKLIGDAMQISSRTTLTKYFSELVDARILSPIKDGREVFYINEDLIRILEG
ncbi:Fic family protein [Echinicola soli]|uniref:Fic family protein n=1 Tax=Echinicola soli TaxID=2591634 RepID=A0A514CFY2_9BACT|nr:Fic/DOC family N-terminal domain-containing protein [Echinicola soli]QDH78735.1 Fic family protein [Echinicola soli]